MDKHKQNKTRARKQEVMKSPSGRGQNTAGDREVLQPKRGRKKASSSKTV